MSNARDDFNRLASRYPPQKGTWTLVAPDGRKWEGSTPLEVVGVEQRERIPPSLALERIYRALDDESPRMETGALCPTTGQPHRMPEGQPCLYCADRSDHG